MLIKIKFRFSEVFFGMMLAIAILAIGLVLGASRHQPPDTETNPKAEQTQTTNKPQPFTIEWLTDDPIAFFTAILCLIVAVQAGLFVWQLIYMNRGLRDAKVSADAALLSARAAIAIELPIIRAVPEKLGFGVSQKTDGSQVHYCSIDTMAFSNLGRTKAFPIDLRCGWTVGGEFPAIPIYRFTKEFMTNVIFEPDQKVIEKLRLIELEIEIPADGYDRIRDGTINFWFYCCFAYLDFMQDRHEIGFCWQRYETFGAGGFWVDPTSSYNRKT